MQYGEVYSALQTHIVDGQRTRCRRSRRKLYEVQKYVSMTNHVWDGYWICANPRGWNRLPPDLRDRRPQLRRGRDRAARGRGQAGRVAGPAAIEGHGVQRHQAGQLPAQLRSAGFYYGMAVEDGRRRLGAAGEARWETRLTAARDRENAMTTTRTPRCSTWSARPRIVTGGNGGIGFGIASAWPVREPSVLIVGRSAEKNAASVEAIGSVSGAAASIVADVTDEASCKAVMAAILAAIRPPRHPRQQCRHQHPQVPQTYSPPSGIRWSSTNLTATSCARSRASALKAAGGGKIINIGSMMSIFGTPLSGALRREQGRRRAAHPGARNRLGRGRHPGQRHPARLDRHRVDQRAPAGAGLNARVIDRTPGARWGVPRISPASRSSWPAPPPISSPAPPSRSTAAIRSRPD